MPHWLNIRHIVLGVLLTSILAWYASQDGHDDIKRACAKPTIVQIIDSEAWNEYIKGIKSKKAQSTDPRDFRVIYQEGFETRLKRKSNRVNKVTPIQNQIYYNGKLIAIIYTYELQIYKWYFGGPDFLNCKTAYTHLFIESLINAKVNLND